MKVVLVTGAYPPQVCGVGDYSKNLLDAGTSGMWQLHASSCWKLMSLPRHLNSIDKACSDAVVIQYPTQGYQWSIVPHLIGIYYSFNKSKRLLFVLHEFSQLSLKAKVALMWVLICVDHVIFTSKYERELCVRLLPRLRKRSTVIPITYNLKPSLNLNALKDRKIDVCYFGQIRPNKGLEEFIDVCKGLLCKSALSIYIAGQVPKGYESYFATVKNAILGTSIRVLNTLDAEAVAAFLNECKVAYLPFPDGVSERRGSFLAALSNGVVVVSRSGRFTSAELRGAFIDVGEDAVSTILNVLQSRADEYSDLQKAGLDYLRAVPSSWKEIARMYEDTIGHLLENRS